MNYVFQGRSRQAEMLISALTKVRGPMKHSILIGLLSLALATGSAFAAEEPDEPGKNGKDDEKEFVPVPEPRAEKTQHQIELGGKTLKYTATAGWLILN